MVAAFDVGRLHWLHSVPLAARWICLVLFARAMALEMWAMIVNPFFAPEIRLQSERGHVLVAGGPYRLLRHPGYLAMLVAVPATALAIGSWLALFPAAGFCLTILKRVGAEEQFLQWNLAGYGEYMGRFVASSFHQSSSAFDHAEIEFPEISRLQIQGAGREGTRVFHSC
jgi:protein-S-isoprenylcysteine O-methyltransferase Ste14